MFKGKKLLVTDRTFSSQKKPWDLQRWFGIDSVTWIMETLITGKKNCPCHHGSTHNVDIVGLTALFCLITSGQIYQEKKNLTREKSLRPSGSSRQRPMMFFAATEDVMLYYIDS